MVVEHGEVEKFLEQEENVTEQLTDPNQVKTVLIEVMMVWVAAKHIMNMMMIILTVSED